MTTRAALTSGREKDGRLATAEDVRNSERLIVKGMIDQTDWDLLDGVFLDGGRVSDEDWHKTRKEDVKMNRYPTRVPAPTPAPLMSWWAFAKRVLWYGSRAVLVLSFLILAGTAIYLLGLLFVALVG